MYKSCISILAKLCICTHYESVSQLMGQHMKPQEYIQEQAKSPLCTMLSPALQITYQSLTGSVDAHAFPTCICALLPAVMFDIVQQASFLMDSFGLLSKCNKLCRAEQFRTTYKKQDAKSIGSNYTLLVTTFGFSLLCQIKAVPTTA